MIARQHKALEGFRRAAQLHRAPPECPYVETTEACGGTQKVGRTSNWSTHRSLLNLTFAMRPIQPELATHSFYERGCQEKTLPRRRGQLDFSGVPPLCDGEPSFGPTP